MLGEIYEIAKAGKIKQLEADYSTIYVPIKNVRDAVIFYKIINLGFIPHTPCIEFNKFLSWREIFFILRKCSNEYLANVISVRRSHVIVNVPFNIIRHSKNPLIIYAYYIQNYMQMFYRDVPDNDPNRPKILRQLLRYTPTIILSKNKLMYIEHRDRYELQTADIKHIVMNDKAFVYYDAMLYIIKNNIASAFSKSVQRGMARQYMERPGFMLDILVAAISTGARQRLNLLKIITILKK